MLTVYPAFYLKSAGIGASFLTTFNGLEIWMKPEFSKESIGIILCRVTCNTLKRLEKSNSIKLALKAIFIKIDGHHLSTRQKILIKREIFMQYNNVDQSE